MHKADLYLYRAIVQSVYDGDTIRADIDLGLGIWKQNEPIRLYGIDAPEVRGPERDEGLKTRDWLRAKLLPSKEITIRTYLDKSGKYGRLLGEIFIDEEKASINQQLVAFGLAERL